MKKLNLNQRVGGKTALIIFAMVLLSITIYVNGQIATDQGQMAEKNDIAQMQQAASPLMDGTDQKQQMPAEDIPPMGTETQKVMTNSGIAIEQSQEAEMTQALPENQKKEAAVEKGVEPDTQPIASEKSTKVSLTSVDKQNNLVYIGILLVLLLVVVLFLKSRKAKNKEPRDEKEMQRLIENRKKKD